MITTRALLLVAAAGATSGAQSLSGVVFLDRNGNGTRDAGEPGVPSVIVSDQDTVVATNAAGEYRIPSIRGSGLIFVSVPDGYRAVSNWWRTTGDGLAFALAPTPKRAAFSFVHASDTHVSPQSVPRTRRLRAMADSLRPDFVIVTGDLVRDALRVGEAEARGYYDIFAAERKAFASPVYTVPGNHEVFGIETHLSRVSPDHPLFGRAMYRSYFGPDYYSFTYGGVHFVGLNTVDVDGEWYYGHVDSLQLAWLRRDIAAIPADMPVVTFDHIPFYTTAEQVNGYMGEGPAPSLITVKGKTQYRHSVSNAADVLAVLGTRRPVLALGGHVHFAEFIHRPGENVRFNTSAATVGPAGSLPSGFTVYTVKNGVIDAGRFIELRMQTSQRQLLVTDSAHVVDELAREPMLVEQPNGTLFVSGYMDPRPKLWKSGDRGASWTRVNVGTEADGAVGNSDVDLAADGAGTLYFIQMGYDRRVNQGTHVALGVSRDAGATWTWTMLTRGRFADRPWIKVAPNGAAHVIWNDTAGVHYTRSTDRGATWSPTRLLHDKGGSSHLAVGPRGEIAVRIAPIAASGNKLDEGVDLVAVSSDGGATWDKRPAPGTRDWPSRAAPTTPVTPRWVEPLAWDASGTLFYFFTAPGALWLARSTDRGATWTTWRLAAADSAYYPYLTARGKGELAATWSSGNAASYKVHVARIEVPAQGEPSMVETTIVPDSWGMSARRQRPDERTSAGEYVPVAFLRDGSLAVVTPIQNERANRYGFTWWRLTAP